VLCVPGLTPSLDVHPHFIDGRFVGGNLMKRREYDFALAKDIFLEKIDMPIAMTDLGLSRIKRRVMRGWSQYARKQMFTLWKEKILIQKDWKPAWYSVLFDDPKDLPDSPNV